MSAAIPTDETLVIETPERVPLHFALASIGNRFLACAVDHGLQLFAIIVLVVVLEWSGLLVDSGDRRSAARTWLTALFILLRPLIRSGRFGVFEWRCNG